MFAGHKSAEVQSAEGWGGSRRKRLTVCGGLTRLCDKQPQMCRTSVSFVQRLVLCRCERYCRTPRSCSASRSFLPTLLAELCALLSLTEVFHSGTRAGKMGCFLRPQTLWASGPVACLAGFSRHASCNCTALPPQLFFIFHQDQICDTNV